MSLVIHDDAYLLIRCLKQELGAAHTVAPDTQHSLLGVVGEIHQREVVVIRSLRLRSPEDAVAVSSA